MIKTLAEWEKVIHPGRRVICTLPSGIKIAGIAGYLHSATGSEAVVQFDDGPMVKITEKVVHLFRVEELS